jgi:two-component system, NarL family, response regulator NreC
MALKLMLADDHAIVRQGLQAALKGQSDFEIVGEAADGPETVRLAERLRPDVLVLDLMMPGLNGLDVTKQLSRRLPRSHIVVLSMHADVAYALAAVRAGASAYVVKEAGVEELVRAIRAVARGQRYFSAPLSEQALEHHAGRMEETAPDPYHTLTFREREVLQLTAEGHSSSEIGERLFISPRTVESHRANLMRKLSVRNQKELIRYAVGRGLLPGRSEPLPGPDEDGGDHGSSIKNA